MNRNFSYISLIASQIPTPPEEAPVMPSLYPDTETELTLAEFSEVITNGDTSNLLDNFYPNQGSEDTIVIDVRTPEEYEECEVIHEILDNSQTRFLNISVGNLTHMNRTYLEQNYGIKRTQTILCICRTGNRSLQAQKYLSNMGFDSFSIFGGVVAYSKSLAKKSAKRMLRA
jgi:rhodanese-related sulfurtransferase